jgi:hypothetical protein
MTIRPWIWLQTDGIRRLQSVPVSRNHRLLWGWARLLLGLTQMSFAITAAYLFAFRGLQWRVGVAALIATVAAVVSRVFYGGRADPRLAASLDKEPADGQNLATPLHHCAPGDAASRILKAVDRIQ